MSREAVVEAAAELADEEGLEALSLSILASRLGIRTPSLYNHIDGLDGLRRALALLGIRELGRRLGRAAIGKTTDEATFAIARTYREFVKAHPGLYAATVRSFRLSYPEDPTFQAAEKEVLDTVLAVLASYGLRGDDALHAARGFRSTVHGFATLEVAGGFGIPLDLDESFERLLHTFVAGLRDRKANVNRSV